MSETLFPDGEGPRKKKSDQAAKNSKSNKNSQVSIVAKALYGSSDHPLRIGDIEIPCYVLEDDRRVIVLGGMIDALGMKQGSASGEGNRLAAFLGTKGLSALVNQEVMDAVTNPILFRAPTGGSLAYGYEATLLADICEIVLRARSEPGRLNRQQWHIAERCELLMRGFARVGIIALVDEATGYQAVRARHKLEQILEQFIAKELLPWAKRFPDDFYEQMFKLRGWEYSQITSRPPKRPGVVGKYTNDIVYARLAPGVLDELKRKNPIVKEKKRRKATHHQWLTEDVGHPKLSEHIAVVIALMKASTSWGGFLRLLNRAKPKHEDTIDLFPDYGVED